MRLPLSAAHRGALFPDAPPQDAGNASTLLSAAGIAVGVMTLTVVLAVMNGFQLGFIESIVEVSSYHLQVHAAALTDAQVTAHARARSPSVRAPSSRSWSARRWSRGLSSAPAPSVVRAVPPDLLTRDPSQAAHSS